MFVEKRYAHFFGLCTHTRSNTNAHIDDDSQHESQHTLTLICLLRFFDVLPRNEKRKTMRVETCAENVCIGKLLAGAYVGGGGRSASKNEVLECDARRLTDRAMVECVYVRRRRGGGEVVTRL